MHLYFISEAGSCIDASIFVLHVSVSVHLLPSACLLLHLVDVSLCFVMVLGVCIAALLAVQGDEHAALHVDYCCRAVDLSDSM